MIKFEKGIIELVRRLRKNEIASGNNSLEILSNANINKYRNLALFCLFLKFEGVENPEKDTEDGEYYILVLKNALIRNANLEDVVEKLKIRKLILKYPNAFHQIITFVFSPSSKFVGSYKANFDRLIRAFQGELHFVPKAGFLPTVYSVGKLLKQFIPEAKTVFNPFCGFGGLIDGFGENCESILGQEIDSDIYVFAKLRFAFSDNVRFENTDSLQNKEVKKLQVDATIIFPPANVKYDPNVLEVFSSTHAVSPQPSNSITVWLQLALSSIKPDGKAFVVLPKNSLESQGREMEIRKDLVEKRFIESIISLPSGFVPNTNAQFVIWVLSKSRQENIQFIALSKEDVDLDEFGSQLSDNIIAKVGTYIKKWKAGEYVRSLSQYTAISISYDNLKEGDCILTPSRHLPLKELDDINLGKTVKIGSIFKIEEPYEDKEKIKYVKKIGFKDLKTNGFDVNIDIDTIETEGYLGKEEIYQGSSLLFSKYGKNLKFQYVDQAEKEYAYIYKDLYSLKLNLERDFSLQFLATELEQEYVVAQLNRLQIGVLNPSITLNDLFKIQIKLPSLNDQMKIVEERSIAYGASFIEHLEKAQKKQEIDAADANSFLRHQVAGPLKNIRAAFSSINKIIEKDIISKYPDILMNKVNEKRTKTFGDYLENMSRDLKKISTLVMDSNQESTLKQAELKEVKIIKLVKDFVDDLQDRERSIEIKLVSEDELMQQEKIEDVIIDGNEELIIHALENLVDNAIKHGLVGFDGKRFLHFQFLFYFDNNEIQLDVANSGHRISEDFDLDHYTRKGTKAGSNAGDGLGGWYINEIMKKHKGRLSVTDEQGGEGIFDGFATSFELYFPIKDFVRYE